MASVQALNSLGLGLGLGMVGVAIIFWYGPPQPNFESGVGIGLEDGTKLSDGRTVAEHDADTARLRKRYSMFSKIGLAFVFVGFAFQFLAVWV